MVCFSRYWRSIFGKAVMQWQIICHNYMLIRLIYFSKQTFQFETILNKLILNWFCSLYLFSNQMWLVLTKFQYNSYLLLFVGSFNERLRPFHIFLFINLIDIVGFIYSCNLFIEIPFLEFKIILEIYLLTC